MNGLADDELVELIKRSDYAAFSELYQRYWKYLYGIAYKKIADENDAADLTQHVFIEFYEKREALEIHLPVKHYLRTAILYKLAKYFRTRGFQQKHYEDFKQYVAHLQEADTSFDTLANEEAELAFEELIALVYQTIEEMPDRMKTIFLMSRSGNYSVQEIADQLGISPQTVKNQVSSALSRIRTLAERKGVSVAQVVICLWLTNN